MQGKENLTLKISRLCEDLPECSQSFLLETGTELANTTRLEYAKELGYFFDFLINYVPLFAEYERTDFKISDLAKVTSQDISRYLTLFKNQGKSERTIARKRASVSSFFSYLVANRMLAFNPVTAAVKVKIHESDEVLHLNIDEQISFLNAVDNGEGLTKRQSKLHSRYRLRDTALITLLLDTGIRVSELHGIDVSDLDLDSCSVVVTRKGGRIQTIYYSDESRDALIDYLTSRDIEHDKLLKNHSPLFTTNQGARLSVRAIEQLVKKYAESNIPGKGSKISPHKLRSSFAMAFYGEERDLLLLQRKLGHKNIQTTNVYAKATDTQMEETRSVLSEARKRKKRKK